MFESKDFRVARRQAAQYLTEARSAFVESAGPDDEARTELWKRISRDPRLMDQAIRRFGGPVVQTWQK